MKRTATICLLLLLATGCATRQPPPQYTVSPVDLDSFGSVECPGCKRLVGATLNPDGTVDVVQSNCPDCGQDLANLRGNAGLRKRVDAGTRDCSSDISALATRIATEHYRAGYFSYLYTEIRHGKTVRDSTFVSGIYPNLVIGEQFGDLGESFVRAYNAEMLRLTRQKTNSLAPTSKL